MQRWSAWVCNHIRILGFYVGVDECAISYRRSCISFHHTHAHLATLPSGLECRIELPQARRDPAQVAAADLMSGALDAMSASAPAGGGVSRENYASVKVFFTDLDGTFFLGRENSGKAVDAMPRLVQPGACCSCSTSTH